MTKIFENEKFIFEQDELSNHVFVTDKKTKEPILHMAYNCPITDESCKEVLKNFEIIYNLIKG